MITRYTPEDHDRAPYAEALQSFRENLRLPLMVPAHLGNSEGLSADLVRFVGEDAVALDIPTHIEGIDVGKDSPFNVAERLAADAWHAERTWFISGGASQSNRTAMLALASRRKGDVLIMQRSAHSSAIDGIIQANLRPEFVQPSVDIGRGIHHGVTPEQVRSSILEARERGERVAGVYVISPSYFGAVADIAGIAEQTRELQVPLIVDGAWGPQFGFSPSLPESPTKLGADIVISSTHKIAGSLSQSAMLHVCTGDYADELIPLVERAVAITNTTSPSSLLYGSLDIARRSMVKNTDLIEESVAHIDNYRDKIRDLPGYGIVSDSFVDYPDIIGHDPLRLSIDVSGTNLSGYEVRRILGREYRIFLEISTINAIVAFIGPGKHPDLEILVSALREIEQKYGKDSTDDFTFPRLPEPVQSELTPSEAYFSEHEIVDADAAVGRISADSLAAYPPGIPNVLPGEIITHEIVDFLQTVAGSPIGYVRGAVNSEVSRFRVVGTP